MKGTYFQRPLEFQIIINGEEWNQGDEVNGVIKVSNHSDQTVGLENFAVTLAYGDHKKIKAKDEKAFNIIQCCQFSDPEIKGNQTIEMNWSFQLGEDCPITEKSGSLYIVYGEKNNLAEQGGLSLQLNLRPCLESFLEIFENFYRFKVKDKKNKKNGIDIKLLPPSSKEFSKVDQLNLLLGLNETQLKLKYMFTLKSLDLASGDMKMKKSKKQFEQNLENTKMFMYKDTLNHDYIKQNIESILDQVKSSSSSF